MPGTGILRPRLADGMRRLAGVRALPVLVLICLSLPVAAQPLRYLSGEHYQPLETPVTHAEDGRIHVVEFFLYSCPHCYALDGVVQQWQRQLPQDVVFRRVPVVFDNSSRFYARLFYTERELGVFDQLHGRIFDAIHRHDRKLGNLAGARAFVEKQGIDGERFERVLNSPAIDQRVARAEQLTRAYRVRAVPSLGVAGRYRITGRMAGGNEAMFDVADYLIERRRDRR